MTWRHQLPVRSPVGPRAIAAGLAARGGGEPLERLAAALAAEYGLGPGPGGVVLAASGTVALAAGLGGSATGGGRPPVVALPAWGCPDLATAALAAGAAVRLYDLEPATLSPDPASLARAAAGAGVVVVAHYHGVPVDLDSLRPLVEGAGALLVDDAAQGAGARLPGGRAAGTGGHLGVLSFGRGKGRTGGRGGALLLAAPAGAAAHAAAAAALDPAPGDSPWRDALALAALWALGRPGLYRIPTWLPWLRLGETVFHPPPPLRGMPPFAAAVVLAADSLVRAENARRAAAARWWLERLDGVPGVRPVRPPEGAVAGWLRLPVLVDRGRVAGLRSPRFRRLGVMPGYPRPIAALPGLAERLEGPVAAPGAAELTERLFTLPTHGLVTPRDRENLFRALASPSR